MRDDVQDFEEEEEREASPLTVPRVTMAVLTLVACGFIVNNAINGQPVRPPAREGTVTVKDAPAIPRAKPVAQELRARAHVEAPPPEESAEGDPDLKELQTSLSALGYYRGPIDGAMSETVRAAIRSAERELGFEETGEPSPALAERLRLAREFAAISGETASTAPAPPQTQAQVRNLVPAPQGRPDIGAVQRALARLGYSPGPADGTLGPKTREAIRLFERDRNLKETGDLSPALLKEAQRL